MSEVRGKEARVNNTKNRPLYYAIPLPFIKILLDRLE